jgi:hypothetical protein
MKALVTGASSGIGRSILIYLNNLGYEIIAVSSDKDKLNILKDKYNCKIIPLDLSKEDNCVKLHDMVKEENIDVLVNNAGFGLFGEFYNTSLETELNMIDLNIKAVHILTKLFLKDFIKKNSGYILNVSSSASFQAGPLMSTYYSTKAYVTRLTTAIYEELRRKKSNVHISVLCPGPVNTNFNKVANVSFALKSIDSDTVAKYAIDQMLKSKLVIVPSIYMKIAVFMSRILPLKLGLKFVYKIQNKKR